MTVLVHMLKCPCWWQVCTLDSFTTLASCAGRMFIKAVSAVGTSIAQAVVESPFQRCTLHTGYSSSDLCWGAVWENILMSESYEWSGCGDNDKARYWLLTSPVEERGEGLDGGGQVIGHLTSVRRSMTFVPCTLLLGSDQWPILHTGTDTRVELFVLTVVIDLTFDLASRGT